MDNKLWHDLHVGCITNSAFHDVVVRRITTPPTALLKRFMGYAKPVQTFAMKRGICTEAGAIKSYVNYMTSKGHIGLTHTSCGLTLCTQASYIGASSDGFIKDPLHKPCDGIVEVKCPTQIDNTLVRTLSVDEIFQKCGKNFYLEKVDGMLKLKRTHRYYMQVQGELGVMNKQWCDFVVYTESKDGVFVERVYFDDDFWKKTVFPKLMAFFREHLAPEILFRRCQLVAEPTSLLPTPNTEPSAQASPSSSTTAIDLA